MPNWFKRLQDGGSATLDKSRWSFSVEAFVMVPDKGDREIEKDIAQEVLQTVLNSVEGDSSSITGLDSNVKFQIYP